METDCFDAGAGGDRVESFGRKEVFIQDATVVLSARIMDLSPTLSNPPSH